jgi:hypothetical protein
MGRELVKVELGKALDAAALPAAMRNGALVTLADHVKLTSEEYAETLR